MNEYLHYLKTSKLRYVFLGFFIGVIGWIFFKGCAHQTIFPQTRYSVAVDRTWYPLALYGREANFLAFTEELLEEISTQGEFTLNLYEVGTISLLPELDNGIYDAVISSLPPTSYHQLKYQFSDPIYLVGPVLLVRSSATTRSLEDLAGGHIGIKRGASLNFDVPFPAANIFPYDNITVALVDLDNNRIDGLILDTLEAYIQVQNFYAGKIKIVSSPLTQAGLRLVTLNTDQERTLIENFNKDLALLRSSGKFDALLVRWGLYNPFAVE